MLLLLPAAFKLKHTGKPGVLETFKIVPFYCLLSDQESTQLRPWV